MLLREKIQAGQSQQKRSLGEELHRGCSQRRSAGLCLQQQQRSLARLELELRRFQDFVTVDCSLPLGI